MTQTENCTLCRQQCGSLFAIHLAEFGGVTYCFGCAHAAVRAHHVKELGSVAMLAAIDAKFAGEEPDPREDRVQP
jgi:hypothetical protein